MPPWIWGGSIRAAVNGRTFESRLENDFLIIKRPLNRGDIVDIEFRQLVGPAPLLYPERMPGYHRYMHGPLVLGVDTKKEVRVPLGTDLNALGQSQYQAGDATLAPLCDLVDQSRAWKFSGKSSFQVLFRD
jgi:hypothetical protein